MLALLRPAGLPDPLRDSPFSFLSVIFASHQLPYPFCALPPPASHPAPFFVVHLLIGRASCNGLTTVTRSLRQHCVVCHG